MKETNNLTLIWHAKRGGQFGQHRRKRSQVDIFLPQHTTNYEKGNELRRFV